MRGSLVVAAMAALAGMGCHPASSSGQSVTPAVGTLSPATLTPMLDADGVTTDLAVAEVYQGTTYGGASDAFILSVQILLDGAVIATVPAQYLISSGSPGDGTYATSFTVAVGHLANGSHTLTVQVISPTDFAGTNASPASVSILAPLPAG